MIKIIKGTYGRVVNGEVEAMTKHSAPFSLSKTREAELVAAGVAVKVEAPEQENEGGKAPKKSKSRKAAAAQGVEAEAVEEATAGEESPGEL